MKYCLRCGHHVGAYDRHCYACAEGHAFYSDLGSLDHALESAFARIKELEDRLNGGIR